MSSSFKFYTNNIDYEYIKLSFLEARRLKNYKDMIFLSELLYGLNFGSTIEPIRFVAEAYYSNKFFSKAINFLETHKELTYEDEHLMLIYTQSLISLGDEKIKKALNFLKSVSVKWNNETRFDILKILLGQVYEMNYLGKEALEVYKKLFLLRPIYPMILKKLFGCCSLTFKEELELLNNVSFSLEHDWALHMSRGLIESARDLDMQEYIPVEISSNHNLKIDFDCSYNVLFQSEGRTITLKDIVSKLMNRYPITHLDAPFKMSKLSLQIQAKKAYNEADYPLCYSICRILLDTILVNFYDVLPLYACSCVILGLSSELKVLISRLMNEKAGRDVLLFTIGSLFLIKSDYQSSILCFKEASDTCVQLFNSIYYSSQIALGHSLSLIGATDQALRAYLLASIIFTGDYHSKLFMGMEQIKQCCYGEALTSLIQAKDISPTSPAILHELAIIHLLLNNYEKATAYSKNAIKLTLLKPYLFCDIYLSTLGKIYLNRFIFGSSSSSKSKDLFIKAVNTLKLASRANLGNPETHSYLGICFFLMGISLQAHQHLFWSSYFNSNNHTLKLLQQIAIDNPFNTNLAINKSIRENIFYFDGFKNIEPYSENIEKDNYINYEFQFSKTSFCRKYNPNKLKGHLFNPSEDDQKIDHFLQYIGYSPNSYDKEIYNQDYYDVHINKAKSQLEEALKQALI